MYLTSQRTLSLDLSQTKELSRLLTAAIVNPEFRNLLLTKPPVALSNGYNGESFEFTPDAQALITSIKANSIEDFASQLILGKKIEKFDKVEPKYSVSQPIPILAQQNREIFTDADRWNNPFENTLEPVLASVMVN